MKFTDLRTFIETRMRMNHVYQPLLIKAVIEAGGAMTVRQIARTFAAADESQVRFYEKRIRQMPLAVLKRHGIVKVTGQIVSIDISKLNFNERTELVDACNRRMSAFVIERGEGVWNGMIQLDPVPQSLRYKILNRDKQCLLCGNGPADAPLEVDHIIPRSKGGSNDESNLQTLCRPCNQGKSNLDNTDFTKTF